MGASLDIFTAHYPDAVVILIAIIDLNTLSDLDIVA